MGLMGVHHPAVLAAICVLAGMQNGACPPGLKLNLPPWLFCAARTPPCTPFCRTVRHPGLKLNLPPWLFCMSCCPDFEFRGTQAS